jgi:hypothetical protein
VEEGAIRRGALRLSLPADVRSIEADDAVRVPAAAAVNKLLTLRVKRVPLCRQPASDRMQPVFAFR